MGQWFTKGPIRASLTTSGYGPDAFQFCKDKPIELIDGGGLLYLLEQAGVKAHIIFPEE